MTNCELCASPLPREIWRGRRFTAIDASSEDFPAFVRIVCNRHAAEMTDLDEEETHELFALLAAIERAMRECLKADKINWAQFGNVVPHLHWHIVARWRDDAYYPECPWGVRQRDVDPQTIRERRANFARLAEVLPALLDKAARQG